MCHVFAMRGIIYNSATICIATIASSLYLGVNTFPKQYLYAFYRVVHSPCNTMHKIELSSKILGKNGTQQILTKYLKLPIQNEYSYLNCCLSVVHLSIRLCLNYDERK